MAAVVAFALVPATAAAERIRCSHQFPPQHHVTGLIERWAAEVERLSQGRLEVELAGDAKLYKPDDNILAVARGDIECAFSLNFQWSRKLPLMYATLAPFAMASPGIPPKWSTSDAARLLERKMRDKGVQSVVWLFQSNQTAITSRGAHLLRPEDFEGVAIRGLVPAFDATLAAIGAAVRPMNAGELYEALRVGVIDATLTDVSVAAARRLYEHQDHAVIAPVVSVYVNGYVSPAWFDLLDSDLQETILEAGRRVGAWSVPYSNAAAEAAAAVLRERGVDVHVATPEEIAVLQAALLPLFLETFLKEAGSDGPVLLEMIRDMGADTHMLHSPEGALDGTQNALDRPPTD
jgi:C4-dicarboxylate-binding protein DctP